MRSNPKLTADIVSALSFRQQPFEPVACLAFSECPFLCGKSKGENGPSWISLYDFLGVFESGAASGFYNVADKFAIKADIEPLHSITLQSAVLGRITIL